MNVIWLIIIVISIAFSLISGNVDVINKVILSVGYDTFSFVIPFICLTCFWNGMLRIANEVGLLRLVNKLIKPLLDKLFPTIKNDQETMNYISTNVLANMFGLSSAATPAGLKAMEGMQKHNKHSDRATRPMITFLVMNTAGVTLLSTTIIAYRSASGSNNPVVFMPLAIVATIFACTIGLLVERWWNNGSD
ncbi:MAG: spore maturation protein A [Erysipelotrichaceae bacterium]